METFRRTYVANFFPPSICVFYRRDKNDVTKSKNCYKTSFVASDSSKFCAKKSSSIYQLTANYCVDHVTDV